MNMLELGSLRSSLALLDDEKGVHSIDILGGVQQVTIVNEAGMYSLVLTSRKPEAKQFKRWITHEVLSSIRKTGSYGVI
jgi:anti-repressor protein